VDGHRTTPTISACSARCLGWHRLKAASPGCRGWQMQLPTSCSVGWQPIGGSKPPPPRAAGRRLTWHPSRGITSLAGAPCVSVSAASRSWRCLTLAAQRTATHPGPVGGGNACTQQGSEVPLAAAPSIRCHAAQALLPPRGESDCASQRWRALPRQTAVKAGCWPCCEEPQHADVIMTMRKQGTNQVGAQFRAPGCCRQCVDAAAVSVLAPQTRPKDS